jgi:beta-N-acetylhexosaminidase
MATIEGDRERLDRVELAPFRAAIAAGVDSVMTAHIAVPALAPAGVPATLAPTILTDLLKRDLGFKGIVITDSLDMAGITKSFDSGEAAVRALEAGADQLLMPPNPDAVIDAVVAAVENGRLTRRRIQESVIRLLSAKERLGLARKRLVDVEAISDTVDSPDENRHVEEIANRAITLVRNQNQLLPLSAPERSCFVVMAESRFSVQGQLFTQEVRRRVPKAALASLDPSMSRAAMEEVTRNLPACENYAVAAFTSAGAYRTAKLSGELPGILEALVATGKPVALVSLGSPYLLRGFPKVAAYMATFSSVPASETAAVRALIGEITISGHMPVSIPGLAEIGEGIAAPAKRPAAMAQITKR